MGGQSGKSGRVEVQYAGAWGTVCDHGWDLNAANVVCRQLGYRRAESANCCPRFGAGTGHILLDEVRCNGNEPSLSFCRHSGWTAHNCSHQNDAGVSCTNGRNFCHNITNSVTSCLVFTVCFRVVLLICNYCIHVLCR